MMHHYLVYHQEDGSSSSLALLSWQVVTLASQWCQSDVNISLVTFILTLKQENAFMLHFSQFSGIGNTFFCCYVISITCWRCSLSNNSLPNFEFSFHNFIAFVFSGQILLYSEFVAIFVVVVVVVIVVAAFLFTNKRNKDSLWFRQRNCCERRCAPSQRQNPLRPFAEDRH